MQNPTNQTPTKHKNPNSSQPQAVPIQLNTASLQSLQQGQTLTFSTMSPGVSVVPQGAQTPTKTILQVKTKVLKFSQKHLPKIKYSFKSRYFPTYYINLNFG